MAMHMDCVLGPDGPLYLEGDGPLIFGRGPRPTRHKFEAPKSPGTLEALSQQVETILREDDDRTVNAFLCKALSKWDRAMGVMRDLVSELANLQLALASAKNKIKALEEQLFIVKPEVSLG